MSTPSSELFRIDPLTGCKNYLGFLETLADPSLSLLPEDGRSREAVAAAWVNSSHYSAVLFVEMNHVHFLNDTQGRSYGDSVIRWMGILLQEETACDVYRVGGVEFIVLLRLDTPAQHDDLMQRILGRMQQEAEHLGFPGSPADLALLFLDGSPTTLDTLLIKLGEAMVRVKNSASPSFMAFQSTDFNIQPQALARWQSAGGSDISFAVRWISIINIHSVLSMGRSLDRIQQDAFTDSISSLPNMRAALLNIDYALQDSLATRRPFSLLMIDGDNIRAYNSISYAAGDDMIRQLCALFTSSLRPHDFIARWRVGDEFMVILPDTTAEAASLIGERFRRVVKETSLSWRFPVTISIGIASCPVHGTTSQALIDMAEAANKRAKDQGKDQVVIASLG
jgi:diguanylate cyclase (GGDEF)-like protein